jgi:broad specificity phosphatase PhoE
MSRLRLLAVRHGQASFEAEDYDQLSPLGQAQAQALGRWLGSHDPRLDEFDHRQLARAFVAQFPAHPASRAAELGRSRELPALLRLLRDALLHWTRDQLPGAAESWTDFRARTRAVLGELQAAGEPRSVLLVSSAGVIAQLAAEALELPDHRCIDLNMSLRNSALCELQGGEHGLQLRSWNDLPHLADQRSMWTHV